jgi:glycosyltransferase involved in cell wall biosynthesis
MENGPLVSILFPVYNGQKFLKYSIESILNQSYKNFEFIILNDGSTDESENIINSYADSRIIYIENVKNLKLIKTLNKGILLAKGKYISRMDADDVADKFLLERQVNVLESNSNIDVINVYIWYLNSEGTKFTYNTHPEFKSGASYPFISFFDNVITHPGIMVRANKLKQFLYLDDYSVQSMEDKDLWNRMYLNGCHFYNINERLLYYRLNIEGVTSNNEDIVYNRLFNLLSIRYGEFDKTIVIPEVFKSFYNRSFLDYSKILELNSFFNIVGYKNLKGQELKDFLLWKRVSLFKLILFVIKEKKYIDSFKLIIFYLKNIFKVDSPFIYCFVKTLYSRKMKYDIYNP